MSARPSDRADLVLIGGDVLTMDPARPTAEAVAVRGGRVAAVGSASDVKALVDSRTTVVELPGMTVLPGVNDSHAHVAAFGAMRPPLALDLAFPAISSIAGMAAAVRDAARELPSGAWLRGFGWDPGFLDECRADAGRQPTRHDLDPGSPANPAVLGAYSGHAVLVNSRALEVAGITAATPDPDGGEIVRDAAGEPTGLLTETATSLVSRHLPRATLEERRAAVLAAAAELHRLGITSVTEPGLGPGGEALFDGLCGTATLSTYRSLAREGKLPLRVTALLLFSASDATYAVEVEEGLRDLLDPADDRRWLNVAGIKIFADGIPPLQTAAMHEPYPSGGYGGLVVDGADEADRRRCLAALIETAHRAVPQIGIHATGDAGIDATVAALVAANERFPRTDSRHYVIHGDFVSAGTLAAMATAGIGLNPQPQIKATISDMMEAIVGERRSAYQWPMRAAIDAGVRVCFSSDTPVVYPDWRRGVASAVTRASLASGKVSGPEQRVSVDEALRAYTAEPAWQDFAESWKGSIAVGAAADLCVLGGQLAGCTGEDVPDMPVVLTVLDGNVVHSTL